MAMHAGLGVTRLLVIIGAGYTGTIVLRNGKLSDVLAEFQNLVKKYDKAGEDGESELSAQVRRLAEEMRRLAHNRPITVLNGNSGQNALSSLVVPAAAFGALGYGYMWWKGISFSDLMYVTKCGMASAVENLTKHLEHVSDALAVAKKHLTQRIENLDGKLDDQVKLSTDIQNDVSNMRGDVSQITYQLNGMKMTLNGLTGRMFELTNKQEFANEGIEYLVCVASGKKASMSKRLQDRIASYENIAPGLMGLKDLNLLEFPDGNNRLPIADVSWDGMEKGSDLKPRNLKRMGSAIC